MPIQPECELANVRVGPKLWQIVFDKPLAFSVKGQKSCRTPERFETQEKVGKTIVTETSSSIAGLSSFHLDFNRKICE
jgi:hypothetical protein